MHANIKVFISKAVKISAFVQLTIVFLQTSFFSEEIFKQKHLKGLNVFVIVGETFSRLALDIKR